MKRVSCGRWLLAVMLGAGCGRGGGNAGAPPDGGGGGAGGAMPGTDGGAGTGGAAMPPDPGPPHVSPASATVSTRRWLQLTADQPVRWTVEKGNGGDASGGTVDDAGLFQAPAAVGTVRVVATNARNESASATLTVVPLRLDFVAGELGGAGNMDGVGPRAYFNGPMRIGFNRLLSGLMVVDQGEPGLIRFVDPTTGQVTSPLGARGDARTVDGHQPDVRFSSIAAIAAGGAVYVSDGASVRMLNLRLQEAFTVAGVADQPGFVDGPAGVARFAGVGAIAVVANADKAYLADTPNNAIRVVDAAGTVTTLAGGGPSAEGDDDGVGAAATFSQPYGLAFDGDHTLYVSEFDTSHIRAVDVTTGAVSTIANVGAISLALDGKGHLFLSWWDQIQVLDLATGAVTPLAGNGVHVDGTAGPVRDGVGADAGFSIVMDIVFDGANSLYVADLGGAIRKVDVTTGAVTTVAGAVNCTVPACSKGPPSLSEPFGIAFAGDGTVLVSDSFGSSGSPQDENLYRVDLVAGAVTALPLGSTVYTDHARGIALSGTGQAFVAGQFSMGMLDLTAGLPKKVALTTDQQTAFDPAQMAWDAAGSMVVANGQYGNVVRVTPTGVPDQYGNLQVTFDTVADGLGRSSGLAIDASGNLFMSGPAAVYQMAAGGGAPSVLAGLPGAPGFADGAGTSARFASPGGLALDGHGDLFVADTGNGLIRRIDLLTGQVSTEVGVPHQRGVQPGGLPAALNQPRQVAVAGNGDL
jgi:sugar lactone lactonase YvrE